MSRLLIEGTSVADFVTSMPRRGRSHSLIRYEETVRYAEFPVLDLSTHPQTPVAQNRPRSHLEHTHREILDMLKWLHDHDVRRIITLRVPDRMAHPHDELEIASVVRRFRVEELDWRILDLSLNIFRPHGGLGDIPLVCRANNDTDEKTKTDRAKDDKTCLRRLHLYTGGRRSALDHWFSAEGLESMKLDYVLIHVIKVRVHDGEEKRKINAHCVGTHDQKTKRRHRQVHTYQTRRVGETQAGDADGRAAAVLDGPDRDAAPARNVRSCAFCCFFSNHQGTGTSESQGK